MKHLIFFYITTLLLNISTLAQTAQEYTLDATTSTFDWTGKAAFSDYALSGTLKAKKGMLKVKNQQIEAATIVIDMTQLHSKNEMLLTHLREKDFFHVKKYQEAKLVIHESFKLQEGEQEIAAELMIKGVQKSMMIPLTVQKQGKEWHFTGGTSIDRTAFGITYNSPTFFPIPKSDKD